LIKLIKNSGGKKDSLRDLAVYVVFFILIVKTVDYVPSVGIEYITAWASSKLFQNFGLATNYGLSDGGFFLGLKGVRDIQVTIIRECTGVHIWGILVALILPLKKADFIKKFTGILLSTFLVFFINIIRIMVTVYLTAFNVPPFSWFFSSPTVSTYHYPISFITGLLGIVVIISVVDKFVLSELGDFLVSLPLFFINYLKVIRVKTTGN
jgi:exosortase/archaeosortase family protein